MNRAGKLALGTVGAALVSAALFLAFMGSMAILNQRSSGAPDLPRAAIATASHSAPDGGVPVLCYHYLRGKAGPLRFMKVLLYVVLSLPVLDDNEVWTQTQGAFEKQMRYLHENGYQTVTLDDLTRWQRGESTLPPNPVVITFDDGDRSVYDYAWPILEKYGFKATYFIITGRVGQKWRGLEFLTWEELRRLSDSGTFEIESHTHDLHYKTGDKHDARPAIIAASHGWDIFNDYDRWEDKVFDDLCRSRDEIERHIGKRPSYLAWPYGHGNEETEHVAAEAGFARTCWLREGMNRAFAEGDSLPPLGGRPVNRYAVSARTSMRTFKRFLAGGLKRSQEY